MHGCLKPVHPHPCLPLKLLVSQSAGGHRRRVHARHGGGTGARVRPRLARLLPAWLARGVRACVCPGARSLPRVPRGVASPPAPSSVWPRALLAAACLFPARSFDCLLSSVLVKPDRKLFMDFLVPHMRERLAVAQAVGRPGACCHDACGLLAPLLPLLLPLLPTGADPTLSPRGPPRASQPTATRCWPPSPLWRSRPRRTRWSPSSSPSQPGSGA